MKRGAAMNAETEILVFPLTQNIKNKNKNKFFKKKYVYIFEVKEDMDGYKENNNV